MINSAVTLKSGKKATKQSNNNDNNNNNRKKVRISTSEWNETKLSI